MQQGSNGKEYEITTPSGKVIALYRQAGSQYTFRLTCDGTSVREFKNIGDAYRAYNRLIVAS